MNFKKGMITGLIFLMGCQSATKSGIQKPAAPDSRILSAQEMQAYGLTGEVHGAEICPTVFDEVSKTHKKTGRCEEVTCIPQPDGAKSSSELRCESRLKLR